MNSQEFRQARHAEYRAVIDTCYPIATGFVAATAEERKAAIHACNFASTKWVIDQKHANTMAQAELDAIAAAKVSEEVSEVTSEEVTKSITAMTPAEQVALSQDRAKEANIRWDEINAAAIVAMNAHKPSANLTALRKYLAEEVSDTLAQTHTYIEELGIWVNKIPSTYDKRMMTRARNKKAKAADKTQAEVSKVVTK